MYSEQKDVDKDQEVEALRAENCLIFSRPSNVSLIDARTMKSYNFANPVYPDMSSTFQIIVNSGGDAVYGRSSYLRLEYTVGSAGVDFGLGTICNIFSRIRITHRLIWPESEWETFSLVPVVGATLSNCGDISSSNQYRLHMATCASTPEVTTGAW